MRPGLRFSFSARLLQFYFIIGILVLGGFWFFYSQFLLLRLSRLWTNYAATLSVQLENETQLRSRMYAKFMSRATEPSTGGSAELDIIFEEVIKKLDFPVIITDAAGRPTSHRNLDVEDPDPELLTRLVEDLDRHHRPIPLTVFDADTLRQLGMIHYGLSSSTLALRSLNTSLTDSVRALTFFSVLQLLLLVGFVTIGIWGILVYKRREHEHIWTALAKETAHQLATPLSSLTGWLEVLRAEGRTEVVDALEQDLGRMREVLDRFSRIGLPPELSPRRVRELVERAVAFVRRRAPKSIRFRLDLDAEPVVMVDEVLFSWMLENLMKNAVDAIGGKDGEIAIVSRLTSDGRMLEIEVSDSGEGVRVEKIFDPGVTTKKYGWGVGLPLARRIVESYHGGKLALKESRPGRTVFAIQMPVPSSGRTDRWTTDPA
ncbi:MAG: HAMP domain-containing histidine kinase [candidate division WOR-3 bacterium]|nr:MAG: HAMP domain-containing histidine kinase [candidate division WOR-3 bacterium]